MHNTPTPPAVNNPPDTLTLREIREAVPKHLQKNVTQEMVDQLNQFSADPVFAENYRDNLISYTSVLREGKYKMQSYFDAVRYVSFKIMGNSNLDAYKKAFPDRYSYFMQNGTSDKDIASYVSAYNKNQLVQGILAQSMTPAYVYNQDIFQAAVMTQFNLMQTASSEKVKCDAANSLLMHLKAPEKATIDINVKTGQEDALQDLAATMAELAKEQRRAIELGTFNAKEVAASKIIHSTAEVIDVE